MGNLRRVIQMARRLDKRTLIAKRKQMSRMTQRKRDIDRARAEIIKRKLDQDFERQVYRDH